MNRDELIKMAEAKEASSFAFFFRHWNMAILTLMGIFLGGIYGIKSLPLESAPEVIVPIGIVSTVYPGGSPSDVEKLVTDRLEEKLKNLDNLKQLTSTSAEGVSSIVVEFDASADINTSMQDLRDEVDNAKIDLPDDAEDPAIMEVRAGDSPIITFSLYGPAAPADLDSYADQLEKELEAVNGVSRVEVSGLPRREMQVLVDIRKLEGNSLSLSEVVNAISAEHIDVPVGSVKTDGFYYKASWKGQFNTAEDLQNLVVKNKNGQNIFLRDIALVREAYAEKTSETRVFLPGSENAELSVTLQVYKKTGGDLTAIADKARAVLQRFKEEKLPPYMRTLVSSDYSDYIREDLSVLLMNSLQTIALIGIILFLMVGRKEATVAALSLPLIYLLSLMILAFIGETFNFLVSFALIISLGIVVDNSIIIVEGIYDHMKSYKIPAVPAALASVALYRGPLLSATLTTVAAFVPLALMSGIIGQYISHVPVTITITLAASFFVAIWIVPVLTAKYLSLSGDTREKPPFMDRYIEKLKQWYSVKITRIINSAFYRRLWVAGMLTAFILALLLPVTGLLKVQMFGGSDEDFFFVSVETPAGTELDKTKEITTQVEDKIRKLPEIKNIITSYGGNAVGGISGGGIVETGSAGTNAANITVNLNKSENRNLTVMQIAEMLRAQTGGITQARVSVREPQYGPPTGLPVEVKIIGEDMDAVESFALQVQVLLESLGSAKEIDNDIETSPGEFFLHPKRDRLAYFGITSGQIGSLLRTAVFGNDSINIIRSGEETPIVVRLDFRAEDCVNNKLNVIREARDAETVCSLVPGSLKQIQNLLISTPRGVVPLSELVNIDLQPAVTAIRHSDNSRVVRVTADLKEGYVVGDVLGALQQKLKETGIPAGIEVQYGGENEDINESFSSLAWAQLYAILLIFAILVYEFNSFRQVLIILCTIPLAIIGVFFGLTLLGKNLSFPGLIGLAALSGIVVNNAIVLIDKINRDRREGMPKLEAIINGGKERLQPIIITTLTTSLGMLPMVFSGDAFADLAVTISIGILFSTILTLVMVPIFYLAFEGEKGEKGFLKRLFEKLTGLITRKRKGDLQLEYLPL